MSPGSYTPEYNAFAGVIESVAHITGGTPFKPHVTLAILNADFDLGVVKAALEEMKSEIYSTFIRFQNMSPGRVAVTVGGFQSPEIIDLQDRFHSRIGAQPNVPHFPHMSLGYTETEMLAQWPILRRVGFI